MVIREIPGSLAALRTRALVLRKYPDNHLARAILYFRTVLIAAQLYLASFVPHKYFMKVFSVSTETLSVSVGLVYGI